MIPELYSYTTLFPASPIPNKNIKLRPKGAGKVRMSKLINIHEAYACHCKRGGRLGYVSKVKH
ncbi:hypothetical protein BT96DRAFT_924798 [Gymnopus androsaceus JB14]|uniref:Uncharacterized protein n=1 Tax=Gymnopus androsaceus JB14 TaxID=1447944 RepID=A0A6A4H2A2_9AGAR|nr:hypothetical protein BT96DRAFT_924798 [Gymnopus androsaceus JB14]